MRDCCDPTSDSHDPVVVRLEREVEELIGKAGELRRELDEARASACELFGDAVDEYWLASNHASFRERYPWIDGDCE